MALLPAEAVNDQSLFIDDLSADELQASVPMPIYLSHHFTDVLTREALG